MCSRVDASKINLIEIFYQELKKMERCLSYFLAEAISIRINVVQACIQAVKTNRCKISRVDMTLFLFLEMQQSKPGLHLFNFFFFLVFKHWPLISIPLRIIKSDFSVESRIIDVSQIKLPLTHADYFTLWLGLNVTFSHFHVN